MMYYIIYEPDYQRIMPAVIIDNRASIPEIKNQVGSVIKSYTDRQVSLVDDSSIVYKIETELGVLAGFFAVRVNTANKTATLMMEEFRPAFKGITEIQEQITNFINNQEWQQDFLFSIN